MNQLISLTPMKSYLFALVILIILPENSFAQSQQVPLSSINVDQRLYDVFEKKYIENISKEDPLLIERWVFYLDNAFFISDNALEKSKAQGEYPSVQIANLDKINILQIEKEQGLKHDFYTETIYKIAGTDKYLIYLAGRDFVEKFNTHMKMIHEKSKTD